MRRLRCQRRSDVAPGWVGVECASKERGDNEVRNNGRIGVGRNLNIL